MKLQSFTEMLKSARDHHFTVGGFNVVNMETMQAVVRSASKAGSPVIVQVYHQDLAHAGAKYLAALANAAAAESSTPVCMSLDHGQSYEQAIECIEAGFSGVMIDLSTEDFNKNVEDTKRVVEYAHKRGVSVEAELGKIFDADKPVDVRNSAMTDPDVARKFVKLTGVDSLAVSVGTAHGMYSSKPKIDFELLKELVSTIDIPIVVHGGSNTPDPRCPRDRPPGSRETQYRHGPYEGVQQGLDGFAREGRGRRPREGCVGECPVACRGRRH